MESMCDELGLGPGRQGVYLRNLEMVCANLKMGDPRSFSRDKNRWSGIPAQYNPMGCSYKMVQVVDCLEAQGYLQQKKGFQDYKRNGTGRDARMMATPKLLEIIDSLSVEKHPDSPLLVMRDAQKKIIEYEDTGRTRSMKALLRRYNRMLLDTEIILDGRTLEPAEKHVHRVFNQGSWSLGGRFYGAAWHTCKNELRPTIRINGEPTVEPDYSALHPTLLYAMAGIERPTGGIYDLPGIPGRKYGKIGMLIMINAEDRRAAAGAYNEKFRGDPGRPKAAEVFDKLLEKHPPEIQSKFFSGIGLKLQTYDSRLTEAIIGALVKEDIQCLSVHDSYIVQEKHKDKLMEIMDSVFRQQWHDREPPEIH